MSGGTIFRKQIADNGFGTGDNCLKIDGNYAYQVPFSFGDNWNKIKLGMYLSFVSGDSLNGGTEASDGDENAGGTTNDTFNWIGLVRNANTKSLPLDVVNQGFVGHKSNVITVKASTTNGGPNMLRLLDANQTHFDTTFTSISSNDGNALATSTFGGSVLSTGLIEGTKGNISTVYLQNSAHNNISSPSHSGSVVETGRGFCAYVGMTFEVNNKGQEDQKISMTMHTSDNDVVAGNNATSKIANVSMDSLKFLINSSDITETQDAHTDDSNTAPNEITGLVFNDGTNAHPLPDSFFFYNAMPKARPRIHAWAVKKFS